MDVQTPRYRLVRDGVIAGIYNRVGTEFESWGWPDLATSEPANATAARVFAYRKAHVGDPWCPPSVIDPQSGQPFLPLYGPDLTAFPEPVPQDKITPAMPVYRMISGRPVEFGRTVVQPGEVIRMLHWPQPGMSLVAENQIAAEVMAYFREYENHPHRRWSMWNVLTGSVFLPVLGDMFAVGSQRYVPAHERPIPVHRIDVGSHTSGGGVCGTCGGELLRHQLRRAVGIVS